MAAAGLPSADFGRFVSNRHPGLISPSCFDYQGAVPVLLGMLPRVSHPHVLESIVRSLSTRHARPVAAVALITLFKNTASDSDLKWAIGNALDVVTTSTHKEVLLELALDHNHGRSRQMVVERLARDLKGAFAVFVGEPIAGNSLTVRLRVRHVWKGELGAEVVMSTGAKATADGLIRSSSCDVSSILARPT